MGRLREERGATLLEATVAIGIIISAVVSLAGLAIIASRATLAAQERSVAVMLAVQKMEQLCRVPAALEMSPGDALDRDAPGFVEYLGIHGEAPGESHTIPGVVFVRRWATTPVPGDSNLLAIQVSVAPCRHWQGFEGGCGDVTADARLATVRSRVAW